MGNLISPKPVRKNAAIHRFVQDGALHRRNESSQPIMIRSLSLQLANFILTEDAKFGVEIIERIKVLGQTKK